MLKHLLSIAHDINLPYIKFYENLERKYESPGSCLRSIESEFRVKWRSAFDDAALDNDSRLGTYLRVNPTLTVPQCIGKNMLETDRLILTRFRCGSHSLLIEKGRYSNIPRSERICSRESGVQNILHCFTVCPLILPLLQRRYANMVEIFDDDNICVLLHKMCKILKIPV